MELSLTTRVKSQRLSLGEIAVCRRDWFELKIENNKLRDEIQDLKDLLKMHHDAKIQLEAMQ